MSSPPGRGDRQRAAGGAGLKAGAARADHPRRMTLSPRDTEPPDRLTLWPVGDGRFGLDVWWTGRHGLASAEQLRSALDASGLNSRIIQSIDGRSWALRVGPIDERETARVVSHFLAVATAGVPPPPV